LGGGSLSQAATAVNENRSTRELQNRKSGTTAPLPRLLVAYNSGARNPF